MLAKFRTAYHNRYLLLETLFWLALARLAIVLFPFRWVIPYLGRPMTETPIEQLPTDQQQQLWQVAWAIRKLSPHTPWQSKCLVQAMAAKHMLKNRQIHSTLYLGVMRNTDSDKTNTDPLKAHAWLRSGRMLLTGGQGYQYFTVVATFADGQREHE